MKTDDTQTNISHFLSLALFLMEVCCSLFSHSAQSGLAALRPVYIRINVFRLWANFCMHMCHFQRARAHARARKLTASRAERELVMTSGWTEVCVCVCTRESALRVCVEDQDSRGDPRAENRTAWTSSYPRGLWGPTPVLLPHVRGMRRLESVVQAHVCV